MLRVYFYGMTHRTKFTAVALSCACLALTACSGGEPTYEDQLDIAADPPGLEPAPAGMVYAGWLPQGVTIVLEDRAGTSSQQDPVFIACDANGWNTADPAWRMQLDTKGRWVLDVDRLTSEASPQSMRYKFTRGTWESVECHADGVDVRNRVLPVMLRRHLGIAAGERPEIEHVVVAWADAFEERPAGERPAVRD